MSEILRGMSRDGSARILVINSRDIVNTAIGHHKTTPTATAALGRLLTGAAMVGSLQGERENRITFSVSGDGPIGKLLAVADYYGNVKGYIENPRADVPPKKNGKLDVGAAVGRGTISVIREDGSPEPHVGTVLLESGEIAEDITRYFAESEQVPTLCALGVTVDRDYTCLAAGGVLVQLLPFADEEVITRLEENAADLYDVSRHFRAGKTLTEIAEIAMRGIPFDLFDTIEVDYVCDCSRERMLAALGRVGETEIRKLLDEEEAEGKGRSLEVACRFCSAAYRFSEEEILSVASKK